MPPFCNPQPQFTYLQREMQLYTGLLFCKIGLDWTLYLLIALSGEVLLLLLLLHDAGFYTQVV